MKILAWNCIGLTHASAIRILRVKVRKYSPDVLFLSETKSTVVVVCNIMNSMGFFLMAHAPPTGTKGGLLLAWRNGVELEYFITNVNVISAWCYSDPIHSPWMLSCVYGSPYHQNRAQFWDSLLAIGANYSGAWLCLGDFNMILDQSEKSGGLPFACSSRDFFRDFMNTQGMVDLGFSGNPFTSSNHRDGRHRIKQRLDRGIASTSWFSLFPSFFPTSSSD
jgi:exonuclease III